MAIAAVSASSRPEPKLTRQLLPNGVLGMLMFVFTEAMLFAGMISAHAIAKSGAQQWPPADQPRLPLQTTLLNTIALLYSGVALLVAHMLWRTRPDRARLLLLAALLLGTFFVVFQGREWVALIAQGLTLTSSAYGGFFYLIVGTHALHAVASILGLAWAWQRLRTGRLTAEQFGTVAVFWYFVVLVWPVIYLQVYL
jgi:cytochrome c oxidase subunit 3